LLAVGHADLGFVGLDDDPANPSIITGKKAAPNKPPTKARNARPPCRGPGISRAAYGQWRRPTTFTQSVACEPSSHSAPSKTAFQVPEV
jgi:hypothetical protein